ncbi:LIM and SH3 domain protein Lasp [Halotydeus destructor]|nr:LIM and SH3 domain protein Lasp [Halotydeus destructor]
MNKCARCGKTVYPTEELKCLDKSWHKGCFKCGECNMTLNMKNYKGYNKMPYCNAHCPQAKATTVADTPEIRRLAENTRIQSHVKYHEDFEKLKGKVTQVADDPETMRMRNASKMISNAAYHGEQEKKKQMDHRRALLSNEANNDHQGNGHISKQVPEVDILDKSQPVSATGQSGPLLSTISQGPTSRGRTTILTSSSARDPNANLQQVRPNVAAANGPPPSFNPYDGHSKQPEVGNFVPRPQGPNPVVYSPQQLQRQQEQIRESLSRKIGSIADYDPMNHNYGSVASPGYRNEQPSYTTYFGQPSGQQGGQSHQLQYQHQPMGQAQPLALNQAAATSAHFQMQQHQQQVGPVVSGAQLSGGVGLLQPSMQQMARAREALIVRAIYDYSAQDVDEVSFVDGDMIVNCLPIDEGWMTGTVQRTGQRGMLPANYVEPMH